MLTVKCRYDIVLATVFPQLQLTVGLESYWCKSYSFYTHQSHVELYQVVVLILDICDTLLVFCTINLRVKGECCD